MSTTPTAASMLDYQSPLPRRHTSLGKWLLRLALGGGLLIGLASILLPSLCKAREPANRAKCASNLHQIGLAIQLYANDNHGQYPDSFATILINEQITPAVFTCPSSNDSPSETGATTQETLDNFAKPHCQSYVYLGRGLTVDTATAATIVAYEPMENHQGEGMNILYGDGHADWLNAREARAAIAKARAATQASAVH